ncbi:alpha/beta hydrolase [bacterium]|nr:alpha/beta hydrolase [bacterium]
MVTMTICLLGPSLNCVAQEDLAKPTMTEEIINARDGSELTAELWKIETIENRKTNSGKVTLAVLRIKSPNPGGEPVFFLAGGPGGSGITAIRQMVSGGGNRFFDLIGGDIVAIDQRGVGQSTPNLSTDASYDFSSLLDATPTDRTARQLAVIKQEAEKFRNKGNVDHWSVDW